MDYIDFFEAPETYNEKKRLEVVSSFLDLKHWEDRQIFAYVEKQIRKCVGPVGITISLVFKDLVYIKFGARFEYIDLPRSILFDSHTILSTRAFVIPDAARDWRTSANPLVTGPTMIRFYCGIPMIAKGGEVIGALSIFDSTPKTTIDGKMLDRLQEITKEFMDLLNKPFEAFIQKRSTRYSNLHSQVDIDMMNIRTKLGRATSKGGYMTIFERDGSGSPYSRNLTYENHEVATNSKIARHKLPSRVEKSVRELLSKTTTIRKAFDQVCKSITIYHRLDCTCIMEIRFLEPYTIPLNSFPKGLSKVNLEDFPQRDKITKLAKKGRIHVRAISLYGGYHDVESIDVEIWQRAYNCEYGLQFRNLRNTAVFNHALVMPFYRVKPSLVKEQKEQGNSDACNVYLRTGGYLLGVFSKISNTFFDNGKISRLYDHVQLVHKVCMPK